MATGGQFHFDTAIEQIEYNTTLYKSLLNPFVNYIPAVQFAECPSISNLLLVEEMEKVRRKEQTEGAHAAARLLFGFLHKKMKWFEAFMKALDVPDLKLTEFKALFLKEKKIVDEKWLKEHPQFRPEPVRLQAPIPSSDDSGMSGARCQLQSDFHVTPDIYQIGLQRDENTSLSVTQANFSRPSSWQEAGSATGDNTYMDARSSQYESAQLSLDNQHIYEHLEHFSLQTDASPIPCQVSGIPEQEVGMEAVPVIPQQHRQQQRRVQRNPRDHPSLRDAISHKDEKNFDGDFVVRQLSSLNGWTPLQEEQEVIALLRPRLGTIGVYVIWYWALARRPTICVTSDSKVITFVVHKTTSSPTNYFINRQQMCCRLLRDLLDYHMSNGILYKPSDRKGITVRLSNPAT